MTKLTFILILSIGFISTAQAASITLDVSALDFGSQTPSDTPQMLATPINVTWDSSGINNWKMRIYTDNTRVSANPLYTGSSDPAGLVGATNSDRTVALKVWCANFGPGTTPPDVASSTYWSDNWNYITDYKNISASERILMRTGTELANPFSIYLAARFNSSATAQSYRTSTLMVELIEQ
jgi:hypothetical protein